MKTCYKYGKTKKKDKYEKISFVQLNKLLNFTNNERFGHF